MSKFQVGEIVRVYGLMNPLGDYKGVGKIYSLGPMHGGKKDMLWITGFTGAWDPDACTLVSDELRKYGTSENPSFSQRNGYQDFNGQPTEKGRLIEEVHRLRTTETAVATFLEKFEQCEVSLDAHASEAMMELRAALEKPL